MTALIIWDPAREITPFILPLLGRPILWYGCLFALGFFLAYGIFYLLVKQDFEKKMTTPQVAKSQAKRIAERTLMAVGLGAILGARLGDVFFYQDVASWWHDPVSILYVWVGGLASHGGAIGILIALSILSRRLRREKLNFYSFLGLLDRVVPCVALAGACIRIGNFFNQEILGIPTNLPWGVLFLHPADGGPIVPRHPVQIYECFTCIVLFMLLYILWVKKPSFRREGLCSGLFLVLLFGSRFLIEFVKVEQSDYILISWLTMGQLLSIPFFFLGLFLLRRRQKAINTHLV